MPTTPDQALSSDKYILMLSKEDSILADFVRIFPGIIASQTDMTWLDIWFSSRAQYYHQNPDKDPLRRIDPPETIIDNISNEKINNHSFKILDIRPNYFRGFRSLLGPITLADGLVVIDGPNSSGKTSIAEAFEWLFTGQLIRRTIQGSGAPRELENCIHNQLRPEGEVTWVEATLKTIDDEIFILRRVLVTDYGCTSTSIPTSFLYVNEKQIPQNEELELFEKLGLNIPPILMQHTLRLFVQSSPAQRRDYFEKLLQLDELTFLIEKAVIGDARLPDFQNSGGGVALAKWNSLKNECLIRSSKITMGHSEQTPFQIEEEILSVGKAELAEFLSETINIYEAISIIKSVQQTKRQEVFPILGILRPIRSIDEHLRQIISVENIQKMLNEVENSIDNLIVTRKAAIDISEANLIISRALSNLEQIGSISYSEMVQLCPLCEYEHIKTLSQDRIKQIKTWSPAKEAITKQEDLVYKRASILNEFVSSLLMIINALIPTGPTEEQWKSCITNSSMEVANAAKKLKQQADIAHAKLHDIINACKQIQMNSSPHKIDELQIQSIKNEIEVIIRDAPTVIQVAIEYAKVFSTLDILIGALSKEDPTYRLRDNWLSVALDQENIKTDLLWELSKKKSQFELNAIRDGLIKARQMILNARRELFSEDMNKVWKELREDKYSSFSQLIIPEPRGRGFPVEIEVKAILDDGEKQIEVDALRVFSESQVHVLGIAAFLTRANLLGHQCFIFDDPVQSMDEEHFLSFSSHLLKYLLNKGLQIIILTHNDLFSRDISHEFANVQNYTTLAIRHSRKNGCQIEEGNRRASERLKKAQDYAEEGKFEESWRLIRLAIERIYLCTMLKNKTQEFNPRSWSDQSAEYMWEAGVGGIITAIIVDSESHLKDILRMTAAGAHDKPPRGLTDITGAIAYLKTVIQSLRIGAA